MLGSHEFGPGILISVAYVSTAFANSCSNVTVMGLFDQSGIKVSEFGIYAAGTFRIAEEGDESKQPMFNLASVNREKVSDGSGGLECKVTMASVDARAGEPDADKPNWVHRLLRYNADNRYEYKSDLYVVQ